MKDLELDPTVCKNVFVYCTILHLQKLSSKPFKDMQII